MSARGGTLTRRGAMHLPLWPFGALIVALVGAAIGLSVLRGPVEAPVPVREQGVVVDLRSNPGMWTEAQAEAYLGRLAAIEASAAAIRELPRGPFHATGRAHEVVVKGDASGGGSCCPGSAWQPWRSGDQDRSSRVG